MLLGLSCSEKIENSKPVLTAVDTVTSSAFSLRKTVSFPDLSGKVFISGDRRHFISDSCVFYFECDCCSGSIIFNPDSTFYSHDLCIPEDSYSTGRFSVCGTTLTLHYSGYCISSFSNEETDQDNTTSSERYLRDTVIAPSTISYSMTTCGDHLLFQQISGDELLAINKSGYFETPVQFKLDSVFRHTKNKRAF